LNAGAETVKIKRYTGTNTREVLTRIRNDLGPDAVILSNREIVGGVELMAAVDFDASRFAMEDEASPRPAQPPSAAQPAAHTPQPPAASAAGVARAQRAGWERQPEQARSAALTSPTDGGGRQGELPSAQRVSPARSAGGVGIAPGGGQGAGQVGDAARTTIPLEQKDAAALAAAPTPPPARADPPPQRPQHPAVPQDELGRLRHELHDLRQWMQSQMASLADAAPLTPVGEQLQALGFSTARARQLGNEALNLRGALAAYLGKGLQVAADPVSAAGIYALVGPTGAGKTTTIAKLAARLVLRHGTAAVALITTDTYRIGGVEQLKIYGRILGVPVAVARDGEELQRHLGEFADRRYVLIDSIGLSPRDSRMAEQMQWLQALGARVTRLLVVGAGLAAPAYAELWALYRRLPVAAVILTKLDESPSFGAALQWLVEGSVPLWFYTDGQRVPEDLHVPSLAKILALLEHDPVTRFDSLAAQPHAAAPAAAPARSA
jgi:flagellar biosynthesis protein FlhF